VAGRTNNRTGVKIVGTQRDRQLLLDDNINEPMLYVFPAHLSARSTECLYRRGVRGIPEGVAATSFPLCKTKMISARSLSVLSTQFSGNTMKTSLALLFLSIRAANRITRRRVDVRRVRESGQTTIKFLPADVGPDETRDRSRGKRRRVRVN